MGSSSWRAACRFWLAFLSLAFAGAADVTSVVLRTSLVQGLTPDNLRGRISAVEFSVGAGAPALGNFRAGAVASLTSPATSAVSGGLSVVAGAALIGLAVPALLTYQSAPDPPPHSPAPVPSPAPAQRAD